MSTQKKAGVGLLMEIKHHQDEYGIKVVYRVYFKINGEDFVLHVDHIA
jgi:hypothetical protein